MLFLYIGCVLQRYIHVGEAFLGKFCKTQKQENRYNFRYINASVAVLVRFCKAEKIKG
jgi:hypothetical protein